MPDREKYIEILSNAVKTVKEFNEDTPIRISLECGEDILALLKVNEPVKPSWRKGKPYCGGCGLRIESRQIFCPWCGSQVKWE